MKNLVLISIFSLFSFFSGAQLMRSEVYDFAINDQIVVEYKIHPTGENIPGTIAVKYELFTVLECTYSNNNSEISCVAQRQTYIPPLPDGNGSGTPSEFHIDTIGFMHNNLDQIYEIQDGDSPFGISFIYPFVNPIENSCSIKDSILFNVEDCQNNDRNHFQFGVSFYDDGNCESIETMVSSYEVISGLGGPYGEWEYAAATGHDPTSNYGGLVLGYFRKNGSECGEFPAFFVGIKDLEYLALFVFPNPAQNKITLKGVNQIRSSSIYGSDGKLVSEKINWSGLELDVSSLQSGVYMLTVQDVSGNIGHVRFIK